MEGLRDAGDTLHGTNTVQYKQHASVSRVRHGHSRRASGAWEGAWIVS